MQSALNWGNSVVDDGGVDSESDGEDVADGGVRGGSSTSKERREIEEANKAAEAEARETAEEKRLRLARDVLMKLDAEQREQVRAELHWVWAINSVRSFTASNRMLAFAETNSSSTAAVLVEIGAEGRRGYR